MKINCSYTEMRDVVNLVPHPHNANKHSTRQIEMLAKIMNFQGWRHPIIVSKRSGFIVAGHGRLASAQLLGWQQAPIDLQDFQDEATELSFLLSDNFIAELAETDQDKLHEIGELLGSDFDHELLGLEDELLIPDADKDAIEDDVPEVTQSISKLGDVYELGEHRLVCGDSTSAETVSLLMNGAKADMVFTDPPYGVMAVNTGGGKAFGTTGGGGKAFGTAGGCGIVNPLQHRAIIGDETTNTAKNNYDLLKDYSKEFIIFGGNYFTDFLPPSRNWIIWDKKEQEIDSTFADCEIAWCSIDGNSKIYRFMWAGLMRKGNRDDELKGRVHPTQKPVGLFEKILNDYDKGSVIDCFGGSGSTLIACEKTKRKCFMMELDPHYIDVIVSRWCKYTGKYTIKRNGEDMEWLKPTS